MINCGLNFPEPEFLYQVMASAKSEAVIKSVKPSKLRSIGNSAIIPAALEEIS